jgi:hypothetical protein
VHHKLHSQGIDLNNRLGLIVDQRPNRLYDRFATGLHLPDDYPNFTIEPPRACLERRTEGALHQLQELKNQLVVQELHALDLLLHASHVHEPVGGYLLRAEVRVELLKNETQDFSAEGSLGRSSLRML